MATTTVATKKTYGFFLDGRWVSEGTPIDVIAPHDGSVIASTFNAAPAYLEAAVRAFDITRKLPAHKRQRCAIEEMTEPRLLVVSLR